MVEDPKYLVKLVLYVIGMAMGIVGIVLNTLGEPVDVTLIAIGLAALGLAGILSLQENKN